MPAGCASTCSGEVLTVVCSQTTDGDTLKVDDTFTFTSTGATGTETLELTGPDGGVFEDCAYTIAVTKD